MSNRGSNLPPLQSVSGCQPKKHWHQLWNAPCFLSFCVQKVCSHSLCSSPWWCFDSFKHRPVFNFLWWDTVVAAWRVLKSFKAFALSRQFTHHRFFKVLELLYQLCASYPETNGSFHSRHLDFQSRTITGVNVMRQQVQYQNPAAGVTTSDSDITHSIIHTDAFPIVTSQHVLYWLKLALRLTFRFPPVQRTDSREVLLCLTVRQIHLAEQVGTSANLNHLTLSHFLAANHCDSLQVNIVMSLYVALSVSDQSKN